MNQIFRQILKILVANFSERFIYNEINQQICSFHKAFGIQNNETN